MCLLLLLVSCGVGPGLSPTGAKIDDSSSTNLSEGDKEEATSTASSGEGILQSAYDDHGGDGLVDVEDSFPNDLNEFQDNGTGGGGFGDNSDAYSNDASEFVSRKLASGKNHACLLKSNGTIWCWGDNAYGQLGNGDLGTDSNIPVLVSTGARLFKDLFGGSLADSSCAIDVDGYAWCWGRNQHGQLGDNSTTNRDVPVLLEDSVTYSSIALSGWPEGDVGADKSHSCGLRTDGVTTCWGDDSVFQLGTQSGGQVDMLVPDPIAGTNILFDRLAVGYSHSCGLMADNRGFCWGDNQQGANGDGTNSTKFQPTEIPTLTFKGISAATWYTCAVGTDGFAYCFGDNFHGYLGNGGGPFANQVSPVRVTQNSDSQDVTDVDLISAGGTHACAVKTDGSAHCWGRNTEGQLGDGANTSTTRSVPATGAHAFKSISTGYYHSCAMRVSDEAVLCWGKNDQGQLGDGNSPTNTNAPVVISE